MTLQTERIVLNAQRNVSLVTMIQKVGGEFGDILKRPAILILPGGGYALCSDREAEAVAYPYLEAGFHAFVLRYSVGEHRIWPNPLEDYDQAMEYILAHSGQWGLAGDKIAVIGFSAGGHLAGCAATLAKHRPGAAILAYAALDQDIASACQPSVEIPSPIDYVDSNTPPCFLFASRDDTSVPVKNTRHFMERLEQFDITYESHIYPYGGHGYSTGMDWLVNWKICRRIPNWVRDSIGFLEDIFGVLTPNGFQKPVCSGKVNGNWEPYLSERCTYEYLCEHKAGADVIDPIIHKVNEIIQTRFTDDRPTRMALGRLKLEDMYTLLNISLEEQKRLNAALYATPNDCDVNPLQQTV